MKNMRQLINLMEGVMAVPGVGAQPGGAGGAEADMQTAGTAARNSAYAAYDASQGQATESVGNDDESRGPKYFAMMARVQQRVQELLAAGDKKGAEMMARQEAEVKKMYPSDAERNAPRGNDPWAGNDWQSLGGNRSAVDEKSTSEKQARFMAAAAHDPAFAKKTGMDSSVAKEFNQADKGTEQLSKAMKHKNECSMMEEPESPPQVVSCNQSNPANADKACAMENMEQQYSPEVQQAMADMENMTKAPFYMEPEDAFDRIIKELSPEGAQEFRDVLNAAGQWEVDNMDDSIPTGDEPGGPDWPERDLNGVRAGPPEDYNAKDYGSDAMEEAFDLQNGYDDINDASGNDYFPSGADSPVVKDTGPSGARQGDNPEQKKMQVDEVHKELVYGYRNFLKESAKK